MPDVEAKYVPDVKTGETYLYAAWKVLENNGLSASMEMPSFMLKSNRYKINTFN